MSSIKIEVTQEDIDRGVLGDAYACPIARALARQFPHAKLVSARPDFLRVMSPNNYGLFYPSTYYEATKKIKWFIYAFDRGRSVKPTVFRTTELNI